MAPNRVQRVLVGGCLYDIGWDVQMLAEVLLDGAVLGSKPKMPGSKISRHYPTEGRCAASGAS
jgi:hypothetical protein